VVRRGETSQSLLPDAQCSGFQRFLSARLSLCASEPGCIRRMPPWNTGTEPCPGHCPSLFRRAQIKVPVATVPTTSVISVRRLHSWGSQYFIFSFGEGDRTQFRRPWLGRLGHADQAYQPGKRVSKSRHRKRPFGTWESGQFRTIRAPGVSDPSRLGLARLGGRTPFRWGERLPPAVSYSRPIFTSSRGSGLPRRKF
jgi:hypothetical protein